MGLGFTLSITILAGFRELIGAGTLFGFQIMPEAYEPATIFILAPGAFFVLAFWQRFVQKCRKRNKGKSKSRYHIVWKAAVLPVAMSLSGKFYDNTLKK